MDDGWVDYVTCSVPLPGLPEREAVGRVCESGCVFDGEPSDADYEITEGGILVRTRAGENEAYVDLPERPVVDGRGDVHMRLDRGFDGEYVARFRKGGRLLWIERTHPEEFQGRARLYYEDGRPVDMTDEEYRKRRRADHDPSLAEDHVVRELYPRGGDSFEVSTDRGSTFGVSPSGSLPMPKPGDEARLYLSDHATGEAGEVIGVDLNGRNLYYELPEDYVWRRGGERGDGEAFAWPEPTSRPDDIRNVPDIFVRPPPDLPDMLIPPPDDLPDIFIRPPIP